MKCSEARRLLQPYLDSELGAQTALEIEEHLSGCAECAGLFAAEEKFDQRLAAALRNGTRTSALWNAAEADIRARRRVISLRRFWPVALAASFALLAAVGSVWFETRPLDLAAAVGECHQAYVRTFTSPEFVGPVPEDIARQLGNRLDVAAFAYRPASPAFHSQGARYCHVGDVPVAVILGHYQDTPVSFFVFKRSELEHFPKTKQRLDTGDPIVCCRTGRYQFAARLLGDHVVCIVGDAPRPRLEELLTTVGKPS